jgi:glucosylglycerol-phosphate synthase
MMLATDLDGTFLGGRQADRQRLYKKIRDWPGLQLVFVTGRGLESVLPLLSDPILPDPAFVIADVGATVVDGATLAPVQPLQTELDRRWPGPEAVLSLLDGIPGLQRQEVPQERRCSFFLDDPGLLPRVEERLAGLDCRVLFSADRYLDVLPSGVSKGSTLARLAAHLGVAPEEVFVAGDTLNDLSLFEAGFAGVAVGNAEPALQDRVRGRPGVVLAERHGAGGILEGLLTRGHTSVEDAAPDPAAGDAQLVIVYHRLPFEERRVGGRTVRRPPSSPNGILPTLLGLFSGSRTGSWIAWSIQESRAPPSFGLHEVVDAERYPHLLASRIALTGEDVRRFYKSFSKHAFWPVIFSFIDRARFSEEDWQHFEEINRLFAERAAAEADQGALVWVHDYNLWRVPAHLRRLRPDLKIAFFHHTSFPPADVFNVLPWRREIVASLLQCDYVGFHVPRYVANFVDVARAHGPLEVTDTTPCAPRFRVWGAALGQEAIPTRIRAGERSIGLGAHPVGVDTAAIAEILERPEVRERRAEIARELAGTRVVLSVERLDYVKGPVQKLESFEGLLEEHPELREQVVLVLVTTPPAEGMAAYDKVRTAVDETVGRINGRFGTLGWVPVRYFYRSLPFPEVLAYCAAADVGWITPLRDGLNLVAKEYVAAQAATGGDGVLVLSEFAGASVELHGALLTNPYDPRDLTRVLARALGLPPAERRERMRRLAEIVSGYDVRAWGDDFLRSAAGAGEP